MGFGSTTEDHDGVPLDMSQDKGPPEEDWRSPEQLRGEMRLIADAKKSMGELSTIEGVMQKLQVFEQQMKMQAEQMNRIIGMYATLSKEFEQYRTQRAIELQSWLANGGSTTPEDNDGSHT